MKVQYYADDWGYHPTSISYGSTSKTASSNTQFAYGEKAVQALSQSKQAAGISAAFSSGAQKIQEQPSQTLHEQPDQIVHVNQPAHVIHEQVVQEQPAQILHEHQAHEIRPVSNGVKQVVSTSSTNGQHTLVINHQPGVDASDHGTAETFSSSSSSSSIQSGQGQRLAATFLVDDNVQQLNVAHDNDNVKYLIKAPGVVSDAENQISSQGHQQVNVVHDTNQNNQELYRPSGNQIFGATALPLQQHQTVYHGANEGGLTGNGADSSYNSELSLEYGARLPYVSNQVSAQQQSVHEDNVQNLENVVSVTPSSLNQLSLNPIVVQDYQDRKEVVVTPRPSVTYGSTTANLLSVTSGSYVSHNVFEGTSTEHNVVPSSTPVPPFYLTKELSSSAFAETHSNTVVSTNSGDSGHIDVDSYAATPQPLTASSVTYQNSPPASPVGYLVSPTPLPNPTLSTIVITPKPPALVELLKSNQHDYSLLPVSNGHIGHTSQVNDYNERKQLFVPNLAEHHVANKIFKDKFKSSTIVEVQKAIPIEFEQEQILSAEEEEQIKHNGIPIDYIQQIVNVAEHLGNKKQAQHSKTVLSSNGGEYGQKINEYSSDFQGPKYLPQSGFNVNLQLTSGFDGGFNGASGSGQSEQEIVQPAQPQTEPDQQLHSNAHEFHQHVLSQTQQQYQPQESLSENQQKAADGVSYVYPVPNQQFQQDQVDQQIQQQNHQYNLQLLHAQVENEQLKQTHQAIQENQQAQEISDLTPPVNQQDSYNDQKESDQLGQQIVNAQIENEQLKQTQATWKDNLPQEQFIDVKDNVHVERPPQFDHQSHHNGHSYNQQLLQAHVDHAQLAQSHFLKQLPKQNDIPVYITEQQRDPSASLRLNTEFLEANQQLLRGDEVQKQLKINQQSLDASRQLYDSAVQLQQQFLHQESSRPSQLQLEFPQINQQILQTDINQQSNAQQPPATPPQLIKLVNSDNPLSQKYNQQLLANVVRKPSSAALLQQSINTNHQSKLKFNLQQDVEKQAEVEKDYSQQLVEESKQDVSQPGKQNLQQELQFTQVIQSEQQGGLEFNPELALPNSPTLAEASLGYNQDVQYQENVPAPQPLVQLSAPQIENNVLHTIPIQQTTHLKQTVLQSSSFQNSQYFPEQYPREQTQIVQLSKNPVQLHGVEHTKLVEVKTPYPVRYPVHVDHTKVIKVARPVHVPHIVPVEVTKLVQVDRPWPYPQPYPVAHPVPVPYAVPHPVAVPVNHYIHYPHIVRVPFKEHNLNNNHGVHGANLKVPMSNNPHFQKEAAYAYLKSNSNFGGIQSHNRPHFSNNFKTQFINIPARPWKSGRSIQNHSFNRHHIDPKKLNIEYGFKPPLIPSLQIPVDPEPEPTAEH